MRKLSVICARNVNNPGMLAVNLSIEFVLKRAHLQCQLRRLSYGAFPTKYQFLNGMSIKHQCLSQHLDSCFDDDAILFLGDFLLAKSYWTRDLCSLAQLSGSEAPEEHIARHLALFRAPDDVLTKAVSYGSTVLGDDVYSRLSSSVHFHANRQFIKKCRMIWGRDPFSANYFARLRNDFSRSHQGIDCALLLRPDDLMSIALPETPRPNRPYACIYFGRTPCPLDQLLAVAAYHCKTMDLLPTWLPWLPKKGKVANFNQVLPELQTDFSDSSYAALLGRLSGASLVVTDTYHLCVHAWNLGIPTICIGYGARHPRWSLSDKKKEVFHYLYGANPYYLFAETLGDPEKLSATLEKQTKLLQHPNCQKEVTQFIHTQSRGCEGLLADELAKLLDS